MVNNIVVGYTPNDFFYSTAGDMPSDEVCLNTYGIDVNGQGQGTVNLTDKIYIGGNECSRYGDTINNISCDFDTLCNDSNFMDNSGNCIRNQLCLNKQNVDFLVEKENSHLDAEKRNNDINVVYDRTIMDSVNLGIGILFILFIIYRNRNVR